MKEAKVQKQKKTKCIVIDGVDIIVDADSYPIKTAKTLPIETVLKDNNGDLFGVVSAKYLMRYLDLKSMIPDRYLIVIKNGKRIPYETPTNYI